MSAVSNLIKVKYEDLTNYTEDAGSDILGVPFEYHWGPVNELMILTQSEFFRNYPESLPMEIVSPDISRYHAYAQIKRAFECGATQVESLRVKGNWKYSQIAVTSELTDNFIKQSTADKQFTLNTTTSFVVSTKYPGIPPKSLIGDFDTVAISLSVDKVKQTAIIKVCGATETSETGNLTVNTKNYKVDVDNPLEEFEGSMDPSAKSDGKSFFLEDVVNDSDFIAIKVNASCPIAETTDRILKLITEVSIPAALESTDWKTEIRKFNDTMSSDATLLISPLDSDELDSDLLKIGLDRQDLNVVLGYATNKTFNKESIQSYLQSLSGIRNMFGFLVVGRETTKVLGYTVELNCLGGWCGHTINVANTVRTNQLASAFSYGGYYGVLSETLTFDEVCELHENGVISVFNSNQGPLIWGVRSLHPKQTSYFGKANVMRVLSKIMRQIFPVCLNAIHTDAAANPITRATYDTMFNRIISDEIANQNLLDDSKADCLGEINSDLNTKGGKIFNLNLTLHFIGLVEKFNIKVTATDSSVTAQII